MKDNITSQKSKNQNNYFTIPAEYLNKNTTKAQYLKVAVMYGGALTGRELKRHSTAHRDTRRKWIEEAKNAEKPAPMLPKTEKQAAKIIEDWTHGKSHKMVKLPIWALDVILQGKSGQAITCLLLLIARKQKGLAGLCCDTGWSEREMIRFFRRQKWIAIYRVDNRTGDHSVICYREGKEPGYYDVRQAEAAVAAIAKGQELRAAKQAKQAKVAKAKVEARAPLPDRPVTKDKPLVAKTEQELAILAQYLLAQGIAPNYSRAITLAKAHPEMYGEAVVWYSQGQPKNEPQAATVAKQAENEQEPIAEQKAEKQGLEAQIKPELVSADSSYFDEPPLESYDLDYCCQGGQRWQEPENEPEPVTVAPATPKTANIYALTRQGWQPANNGWKPYFERQGGNIAAIFEATLKALEYNPDLHAAYLEQLNEQAKFGEQADQWWQGIKAKYNIKSKY